MKKNPLQKTVWYALFFTLYLALSSCGASKQVSRKTINHNYFNLIFNPEKITNQSINETEISITPVDAKSLNRETFDAASRDGNYEKELATSIEQKKGELKGLSKQERFWILGKINAIENVTKLERDNKIPSNLASLLKIRIWFGEQYGKDGTEITSLSDVETFSDDFNPFRINDKYLSIFKITFENKGNDIEKINLKEFQVISGEEQLYPLASEYFENNLKEEPEKIKNAYRMNMPSELTITPNQKITKYIAIPAINTKNEKLQIQFIRNKKVVDFNFTVKERSIEKNYNVESYYLMGEGESLLYKYYYVVGYKKGVSFATKDNRVFVSEEKINTPLSIYAIGINLNNSETLFGYNSDIKFVDFPKNRIKLEFKKIKKEK